MPRSRSDSPVLVALYGPTSSGKTALSLDLGERLRDDHGMTPVVISADSRQVYEHMDIGTSKIGRADIRGIRHEMIDVTEPVRKLELEAYVAQARGHIEACFAAGELPMIVGGTAVYVKSLLEGWDVDRSATAHRTLRKDFPPSMAADAHATLRRLDRAAAGRVHPNNYEGVINALAAAMGGREREADAPGAANVTHVVLGLDRPPHELDDRVARAFDDQMDQGLLEEVVDLADRYDLDAEMRRHGRKSPNQVLHTHGYREFFEVASDGGKPVASLTANELAQIRERVVGTIQAHTRRQRGALRKMPGLVPVRTVDEAERRCVSTSARRSGLRY